MENKNKYKVGDIVRHKMSKQTYEIESISDVCFVLRRPSVIVDGTPLYWKFPYYGDLNKDDNYEKAKK